MAGIIPYAQGKRRVAKADYIVVWALLSFSAYSKMKNALTLSKCGYCSIS
jgi:hypothetical protein